MWIREFYWLYYRFRSADRKQLHAWLYTSPYFCTHQYTARATFEPDVQFFSTRYLTFFFFLQWDYGKFILKQLDYSPLFSTSDLLVENSGS